MKQWTEVKVGEAVEAANKGERANKGKYHGWDVQSISKERSTGGKGKLGKCTAR